MSESRGKQRRFTAEEKRAILTEAEQPGVTITAVCRKHGIAATQFYRWRAVAEQGVEAALKADGRGRAKGNGDAETARLQAEIERLRAVVTEITAENLELKKRI
jgi:transposase